MMRLLRKKTKAIMIIVAVSFVVGFIFLQLGVGTGGRSVQQAVYVGKVNGVEISFNDFQNMLNNIIVQLRQQGRDDLTDEEYDRVENQAWNEIVFNILIQQEINKRGISRSAITK